jgi:hypothetical protein
MEGKGKENILIKVFKYFYKIPKTGNKKALRGEGFPSRLNAGRA